MQAVWERCHVPHASLLRHHSVEARLVDDESTQGAHEAVSLDGKVHLHDALVDLTSMQDRHGRVQVVEEEGDACMDQLRGQQSRSPPGRRRWQRGIGTDRGIVECQRQFGDLLTLPQLGDDLGPASLGTLLLRRLVVGTGEGSLGAVVTWMGAIASDLLLEC